MYVSIYSMCACMYGCVCGGGVNIDDIKLKLFSQDQSVLNQHNAR